MNTLALLADGIYIGGGLLVLIVIVILLFLAFGR